MIDPERVFAIDFEKSDYSKRLSRIRFYQFSDDDFELFTQPTVKELLFNEAGVDELKVILKSIEKERLIDIIIESLIIKQYEDKIFLKDIGDYIEEEDDDDEKY